MITDRSKQALIKFLETMGSRGTLPAARTTVWLVAIKAILSDLTPEEENDVRKIDLDAAFQRRVNREPNKYGPSTLQEYRNRITQALAEFDKWAGDPSAYKYSGRVASTERTQRTRRPGERGAEGVTESTDGEESNGKPSGVAGLPLQYPLRADFLAKIVVPVDMKGDEAKRLAAFIRTLATDFVPADQ